MIAVKAWILVFMFNGVPMASGPHDLDGCLEMAATQTEIRRVPAHCWNPKTQERKRPNG